MKKYIKSTFIVGFICLLAFSSCNKYYEDSGTHVNNFDGTIVDYIKLRKDLFDSLYKVIQYADLESTLANEKITFFAPADPTIRRSIFALNDYLYSKGLDTVTSMTQIDKSVWKDFLSMYVYRDVYLLKDIPPLDTLNMSVNPGQAFVSYGAHEMIIGVLYNDVVSGKDEKKQVVENAGYRQLYLSKIYNISNLGGLGSMINVPIASSDIKVKNGVIHALKYQNHVFGFNTTDFVNAAFNKGIKYK